MTDERCPAGRTVPGMKNPWMSLWLSAANQWAGVARAMTGAEVRRQQNALVRAMAEGAERAWMGIASASMPEALGTPPAPAGKTPAGNAPVKKRRAKARRAPRPR